MTTWQGRLKKKKKAATTWCVLTVSVSFTRHNSVAPVNLDVKVAGCRSESGFDSWIKNYRFLGIPGRRPPPVLAWEQLPLFRWLWGHSQGQGGSGAIQGYPSKAVVCMVITPTGRRVSRNNICDVNTTQDGQRHNLKSKHTTRCKGSLSLIKVQPKPKRAKKNKTKKTPKQRSTHSPCAGYWNREPSREAGKIRSLSTVHGAFIVCK